MLGQLQDNRGQPGLRTRAMAAVVIVGLIIFTAPVVVIPIIEWLFHQL
jgi:hypothetical protein